jgi:hypothetical protein
LRLDYDTSQFDLIAGRRAGALLDAHPDGRHVALQAGDSPLNRAGVWDASTGRLVWEPEHTVAMSWLPNGREVLLVHDIYERAADHPPTIVTELQSETIWVLERRRWPERALVRSCTLSLPTGWFDDLVVSPRGDLAAVYWQEQHCAGCELVVLGRDEDRQLEGTGIEAETNWVLGPVFSPDGRYILLSCGPGLCWWADDAVLPDTPSAGGRFRVGEVLVYDAVAGDQRAISVEVDVPPGWMPDHPEGDAASTLGAPEFSTTTEFSILLPTGARRTLSLTD